MPAHIPVNLELVRTSSVVSLILWYYKTPFITSVSTTRGQGIVRVVVVVLIVVDIELIRT